MGFKEIFNAIASSPVDHDIDYLFNVGDFFLIKLVSIDDRPMYMLENIFCWLPEYVLDNLERVCGTGDYKIGDIFKVKIIRLMRGYTFCYKTGIPFPYLGTLSDIDFYKFKKRGEIYEW